MKRIILLITLTFCIKGLVLGQKRQMNIGSYNIRYENASDSAAGNGWKTRYPVIAEVIKFNDLDIVGVQEGFYSMLNNLTDSLPGYKWLGVGRDGVRKGEHSAIFYKETKFKCLKSGTFWLSPTDTAKPNVGWDAALTRVCTWAQFKEIKTGFVFYFFNVHMDHVGVVARNESAKLILNQMKQISGNTAIILTGDFNADQNSTAYATLKASGILKDCFDLSPIKLAKGPTFNSFKLDPKGNARIDHIFINKGFKVNRYGILSYAFNGKLPSDHNPVVVNVSY